MSMDSLKLKVFYVAGLIEDGSDSVAFQYILHQLVTPAQILLSVLTKQIAIHLLLHYKLIIPLPTYPVVRLDVSSPLGRYSHLKETQHPALYIYAPVVLVYNP